MQTGKTLRWVGVAAAATVAGILAAAAAAWACIAGPLVTLNPSQVTPGQEITVNAISLSRDRVVIRWNALDGPILASVDQLNPDPRFPTSATSGSIEGVTVRVPADAKPGNYVLVVTQVDASGKMTQVPTRALVTVTGAGQAPLLGAPLGTQTAERPVGLVEGDTVSTATKVLIALGVAGVAMFVAGVAAFLAGRRPAVGAPARVRTGS
jgi:hypothetical protein